ncbi:MAG: hypothetical protein O2913_13455, partial [Chloroflexi bacterium]|nr:hypothetical protein [Chloroflexota bacterium]
FLLEGYAFLYDRRHSISTTSDISSNISGNTIQQIGYLGDIECAVETILNKHCTEKYPGVVCLACGARSLHALYIGYSFVERLCEICGSGNETPQTNRYGMSMQNTKATVRVL